MYFIILALTLSSALAHADEWTPPQDPDPQAILEEAQKDTEAKQYKTALAKYVWFHQNALSIDPALHGVRLSFALTYWHELAKEYPPALKKLKNFRDQATQRVMKGNDVCRSFGDMAAINERLGEVLLTKKTFEVLDRKDPKGAKQAFDFAKPALVKAKAYTLYVKYVEPKRDFAKITEAYKEGKRLADNPRFGPDLLEFMNKQFANEVTTLVAILVVSARKTEAEEIALSARKEWEDSAFSSMLDEALKGIVPEPWP